MRSRILAVLAMLLLAGTSHGWAQETTGAVSGRVTDAQGLAVPGVTVTLTGPQGSKSAVTDADGRYNVPLLVPGTYTAKAELQGFKSVQQQNVIVRLGQSIEVQLKMEVGGVAETIEVTASSPTVDTRSTTVGAVLDSEMLKNVPVGRRFSDALYLAPGVTSSGSAGSANPSMGGGSGLDNQYVVDGVNITNTGYGALGSYSIVFGSLGNGTPYDFVKEVQVKTGGYEAEYGQAIGGVVNVVTKSGTNKLQGSVFGYIAPARHRGRLEAVRVAERHRADARHRPQRRRRDARRADHEGQAVLLRRDRSELGDADLPGAEQQGRRRQLPVPALHAGRHRPEARDHVVLREGHLQPELEPPLRRVVLRRSGARRRTGRSAPRRCSRRTRRSTAS